MGKVLDLEEMRSKRLLEAQEESEEMGAEDAVIVYCSDCGGIDWNFWMHNGEPCIVCANDECGQYFTVAEVEEGYWDGMQE